MSERQNHLLVITDDWAMSETIRTTMLRLGYRTTHVALQAEAESHLAAGDINLIVCERLMRNFDTFRFVEQVMFDPRHRHIPMIFLAPEGVVIEGMRVRSDIEIVLMRPVDPLKLVAAVSTLLERGTIYTQIVRTDPLTKLLNRATIEAEIDRELSRVKRYQCSGSLLFLDLDHFKKVNDVFGHAVGDQTLHFWATLIQENIRKVDLAGRYGGEEFLVYLPETSENGAVILGNRLLETCRTAAGGPPGVVISFSGGVVESPRDGTDFATLVERADQAMYAAKSQGRGRVLAWHEQSGLAEAAGG